MSKLVSKGTLGAVFHKAQLAFVLAVAQIVVAIAGIRSGKTHSGAFKMIMYALMHPCGEDEFHVVSSPTYPMSGVPQEKIFALLFDKKIFPVSPFVKFLKSKRTFILRAHGGGTTRIRIVSMHKPDAVRGIKALSWWADEAAYMTRDAWKIVQGRVADSEGPIWITTTPAGYNFVYDLYERSRQEKEKGIPPSKRKIRFLHWTSHENIFIKQGGIQELMLSYDSQTLEQEVNAKFIKTTGRVYHAFSKKRNLMHWRFKPGETLHVGQDFNVASMASVLAQKQGNRIHCFAEREKPGDTFQLVEWMLWFCKTYDIPQALVKFHPDASGKARSTSGKSDFQIIKEAGFKYVYHKRNPFVKDRVNCVNGLLRPQKGPVRLTFDPSMTGTIKCLEQQIWDDSDPPEPDKTQGFDHKMDALGYLCYDIFPLRQLAGTGTTKEVARG